jgi:hypothetical protein
MIAESSLSLRHRRHKNAPVLPKLIIKNSTAYAPFRELSRITSGGAVLHQNVVRDRNELLGRVRGDRLTPQLLRSAFAFDVARSVLQF